MKNTKYILLILGLALFLESCNSVPRGPYNAVTRHDDMTPHQLTHGVTMLDLNVRNSFLLVNHTASRTPAGQIVAKVTLQNVFKKDDLWADVQFNFYDKDNQPIEKTAWRTVYFPPQELILVEGNSIRTNVEKFNILIKNLQTRNGKKLTYPGQVYEYGQWKEGVLPL